MISSTSRGRIDAARNERTRNIKKVVFDFTPEGKDAATEEFGPCYELAKYIRTLCGPTASRRSPSSTARSAGHTVLPAIACDQLGMSAGATLSAVSPPDQALEKMELQAPTWKWPGVVRDRARSCG